MRGREEQTCEKVSSKRNTNFPNYFSFRKVGHLCQDARKSGHREPHVSSPHMKPKEAEEYVVEPTQATDMEGGQLPRHLTTSVSFLSNAAAAVASASESTMGTQEQEVQEPSTDLPSTHESPPDIFAVVPPLSRQQQQYWQQQHWRQQQQAQQQQQQCQQQQQHHHHHKHYKHQRAKALAPCLASLSIQPPIIPASLSNMQPFASDSSRSTPSSSYTPSASAPELSNVTPPFATLTQSSVPPFATLTQSSMLSFTSVSSRATPPSTPPSAENAASPATLPITRSVPLPASMQRVSIALTCSTSAYNLSDGRRSKQPSRLNAAGGSRKVATQPASAPSRSAGTRSDVSSRATHTSRSPRGSHEWLDQLTPPPRSWLCAIMSESAEQRASKDPVASPGRGKARTASDESSWRAFRHREECEERRQASEERAVLRDVMGPLCKQGSLGGLVEVCVPRVRHGSRVPPARDVAWVHMHLFRGICMQCPCSLQ